MTHIYLAQWEYSTVQGESYWHAPGDPDRGGYDLRTLSQQKDGAEGYGIFTHETQQTISGAVYLGTDLHRTLTAREKTQLETLMGRSLTSATPLEFMWDMRTKYADPKGETGPMPLRPNKDAMVHLSLRGFSVVKEEPRNTEHTAREIAVFQENYRRNKARGMSEELLQKWTGATIQKVYRRMDDAIARQVLPQEYQNDGWRKPETTVTETWPTNSTDLSTGQDEPWTEGTGGSADMQVASGVLTNNDTGEESAICDTALSTDDQRHEADATRNVDGNVRIGVRSDGAFSASTVNTGYLTMFAATTIRLFKFVAGAQTLLDSDNTINQTSVTMYVEADGSDITGGDTGGSFPLSASDGDVSGEMQFAVYINRQSGVASANTLDNHTVNDLAVAGAQPPARSLSLLGVGN